MSDITTTGGSVRTMTSLEIAELVGKEHRNVMRDIRAMLESLKIDLLSFEHIYQDAYGRDQQGFKLPYDETVCLLTGYDAKARMAVIKRWRDLESGAPAITTPQSFSAALRLAAEQAETIEAQALQLAAAAPAIEFVDQFVDATGLMGFRQVCKLLGANETRFADFLETKSIWYRLGKAWTPHAAHIDAGRCVVKAGVAVKNERAFSSAKFTAKGVNWIVGLWAQYNLGAPA